ncbi:TIGR04086 family membrane protein [Mucilaginibacter robiniae]|uniref:TIGR04086 family membrane protein n=1 Tax=Mucilaginibacter robiniae TaxID=2728022 RepID=A0A7L5E204_9SPHI|nr:TIGR04086 family membrane protein [Mucilaginibacter robiniae]QJD97195.1 TIGR04086 family membrane protein [Mucilaginibacter robiniae]
METQVRHPDDAMRTPGQISTHTPHSPTWHQRISWAAVFAGFIVAVLTQLSLTLLGVAIGMSTVDAVNHDTPGTGLAIGSGIWSALSIIISLFAGGWVAGRLAKDKHTSESMIHGILVAGLLFILTFYLLSNAIGSIVGGAGNVVGKAVSSATPSLKQAAQERYQPGSEAGKQQLSTDSANISEQVAANKDDVEQTARQVADDAASAAGKAALYSFIGVLLGTGAAAFGAKLGRDSKVPHDYHTHHLAQVNPVPDKRLT